MKSLTLYPSMLASYHTVSRTGEIQGDKTSGSVSITYEQGQYLRHNPPVDGVPVESVDWGEVAQVVGTGVVVAGAIIAIAFAAPVVIAAIGTAATAIASTLGMGVATGTAIVAIGIGLAHLHDKINDNDKGS